MFFRYVISVGVLFASLTSLQAAAYAYETTPSSKDSAQANGWDKAFGSSFKFSSSFADTSAVAPTAHTYLRAGVSTDETRPVNGSRWQPGQDYHDTGTLGVAEAGGRVGRDQFGMGSWQYTANPDALTPPDHTSTKGVYVTAERTFYNTDGKAVVGFATAGHVPGDIEMTKNGWSSGLVMKGFVKDRPDGQFRLGVAGGTNTSLTDTGGMHPFETRFELTYQDKISDNITIQPGLNYTVNPGNKDINATKGLVAGVRMHIQFK
jgi:hypothetical protein